MRHDGIYKKLVRMQFGMKKAKAVPPAGRSGTVKKVTGRTKRASAKVVRQVKPEK